MKTGRAFYVVRTGLVHPSMGQVGLIERGLESGKYQLDDAGDIFDIG